MADRPFPKRFLSTIAIALLCLSIVFSSFAQAQVCDTDAVVSLSCQTTSDPGVVGSQSSSYRHVGNPIDVISGSKQQREIDYQAVGSALHFSRYYHSAQTDANFSVGQGWRHSYMVKLYKVGQNRRRIQQADGRWIDFSLIVQDNEPSLFLAAFEKDGYLVGGDSLKWRLPDGRTFYFQGSFLTGIEYPHGNGLKLFYKNSKLVSVTDQQGRKLRLEYTPNPSGLQNYAQSQAGELKGHLRALHLPSGQSVHYRYDAKRNLTQANLHASSQSNLAGRSNKHSSDYEYLNLNYPNHLSSIRSTSFGRDDKRTWGYDTLGRVTQFRHPSKKVNLLLRYEDNVNATDDGGVTTVDYSHGRQEHYKWNNASGAPMVFDVMAQDCFDCKPLHLQPSIDKLQVVGQGLGHKPRLTDANKSLNVQASNSASSGKVDDFPQLDQLTPVPQSLDQKANLTVDGATHSIILKAARLGEIDDVSVGSTSLSDLKDKWTQGNIEKCESQPLLRRSQIYPSPLKGCLEDLIYLIELVDHVEDLSREHGLKRSRPVGPKNPKDRSGATDRSAAPCFSNPFRSCSDLERDFQLAQLSSCAYVAVVTICGEHWQAVTPASLGFNDTLFNDGSFAATLFYNANSNEYVLAFRGSDNFGDWKDNFLQASGAATKQYKRSVALAKALRQALPAESIRFTGHSLGGGLATAAALAIDTEATVFNPAALHPDTAMKLGLTYADAQKLVSITTVDGDLLTAIQDSAPQSINVDQYPVSGRFPAPGAHRQIGAPSQEWIDEEKKNYSFLARGEGVILHSIHAVLESEESMLVELCGKTPSRA